MRRWLIQGAVTATLAVATLAAAGPATARAAADGDGFGEHVASCARNMGFDGVHNPGMHMGITGWDGSACES